MLLGVVFEPPWEPSCRLGQPLGSKNRRQNKDTIQTHFVSRFGCTFGSSGAHLWTILCPLGVIFEVPWDPSCPPGAISGRRKSTPKSRHNKEPFCVLICFHFQIVWDPSSDHFVRSWGRLRASSGAILLPWATSGKKKYRHCPPFPLPAPKAAPACRRRAVV